MGGRQLGSRGLAPACPVAGAPGRAPARPHLARVALGLGAPDLPRRDGDTLLLEHGPVVEVGEAREGGEDRLPVLPCGAQEGVPGQGQAREGGKGAHRVDDGRVVDVVVAEVKVRQGTALGDGRHVIGGLEAVAGQDQRREGGQARQRTGLDALDGVLGQVQRVERGQAVQPLDPRDGVLRAKEANDGRGMAVHDKHDPRLLARVRPASPAAGTAHGGQ